jgi:hypothetical protein
MSVRVDPEPASVASSLMEEQFDGLRGFVDHDHDEAAAMQEAASPRTPSTTRASLPSSSASQLPVAAVARAVAPRKEMGARPPLRRQAADRIARRWRPSPAVSTEAVYGMLTDMASFSTFAIAAAAQRRLKFSENQQTSLRRRLSAAAHTERQMVNEVRELLPMGPLDGNSATVTVTRLQAWLQRHSQRPSARVNE